MRQDIVLVAIRREYTSRRLNVARDQERADELQAQLSELRQAIIDNKMYIAQLEGFAAEQGWSSKDLMNR